MRLCKFIRPDESPPFAPNPNKKSDVRSSERRTFTVPVLCYFPARRVEVARCAETRLAQRYFGNQAAAVHECQREAELSATFGRLLPHQQAEGRRVQRRLGLCF